jgi:hypothetical protein
VLIITFADELYRPKMHAGWRAYEATARLPLVSVQRVEVLCAGFAPSKRGGSCRLLGTASRTVAEVRAVHGGAPRRSC